MNKLAVHLLKIKHRYFKPQYGIVHKGDCEIYRCKENYGYSFCSCGLLHDLKPLDWELCLAILPSYEEDLAKQEPEPPTAATQEECKRILEEAFGKTKEPTYEDRHHDYLIYKKALEIVFGDEFPEVYARLHSWLEASS